MTSRQTANIAGLLGALGAGPSLAADTPCSGLGVGVDADVRARWPGVPESIREAGAARLSDRQRSRLLGKESDDTLGPYFRRLSRVREKK